MCVGLLLRLLYVYYTYYNQAEQVIAHRLYCMLRPLSWSQVGMSAGSRCYFPWARVTSSLRWAVNE